MLREWMTTMLTIGAVAFAACAQQSEVGTTIEPGEAGQEGVEDTVGADVEAEVDVEADVEPRALPRTWQATATNVGESTVMAEIAIRDKEDDGTFASIALEGGEASHTYPWHIHEGECGSGGAIVGDAAAYNAVTTDAEGEGQADADLAIDLREDGNYYINVHQSPDDLGTIVACGEVETQ